MLNNATSYVFGGLMLAGLLTACGGSSVPPTSTAEKTALSTAVSTASPTPTPMPHQQKLYVVDQNSSAPAVATYQLDGTLTTPAFALPTTAQPCSIAADWDGHVYVGDRKNGTILIYDPNGAQIKSITGFQTPCGLAVKNKTLYVADRQAGQIKRYALPFDIASKVVVSDYYPRSIAADTSGNMYVADTNRVQPGNLRVTIFSPSGTVVSTLANDAAPFVIALDSSNNVYLGDTYQSTVPTITEFASNGTQLALKITLQDPGPWGLAVDESGRIYASQGENGSYKQRVVQYSATGVVIKAMATNLVETAIG